jgi:hypothetical protein
MLVEFFSPASKAHTTKQSTLKAASKAKIIQRLWNAAETQICEIEQRLSHLDSNSTQFEKDTRSIGHLAKFLKELVSIEHLMSQKMVSAKASKLKIEVQNAPPRNLELFREELEKRLIAMRQGGNSEAVYEQN